MLTHEQYNWMKRISEGGITMEVRDQFREVFYDLKTTGLISYDGQHFYVTESGKRAMEEAERTRAAENRSSESFRIDVFGNKLLIASFIVSALALAVSIISLVIK